HGMKLEEMRALNERMQAIESEADRLILDLYKDMFSETSDPIRLLLRKDLFELLEKAIDRCRDAGNVIYAIVLKNS
ncbi:MAG TPA: pit accessory protein, partial [Rudaea sp.]